MISSTHELDGRRTIGNGPVFAGAGMIQDGSSNVARASMSQNYLGRCKSVEELADIAGFLLATWHRQPADRPLMLQYENIFEAMLENGPEQVTLEPKNSYYRMIAHRIADIWKLEHNTALIGTQQVVVVRITPQTKKPETIFRLLENGIPSSEPGKVLLKRPQQAKQPQDTSPPSARSVPQTYEQRVAKYSEVRERIFGQGGHESGDQMQNQNYQQHQQGKNRNFVRRNGFRPGHGSQHQYQQQQSRPGPEDVESGIPDGPNQRQYGYPQMMNQMNQMAAYPPQMPVPQMQMPPGYPVYGSFPSPPIYPPHMNPVLFQAQAGDQPGFQPVPQQVYMSQVPTAMYAQNPVYPNFEMAQAQQATPVFYQYAVPMDPAMVAHMQSQMVMPPPGPSDPRFGPPIIQQDSMRPNGQQSVIIPLRLPLGNPMFLRIPRPAAPNKQNGNGHGNHGNGMASPYPKSDGSSGEHQAQN